MARRGRKRNLEKERLYWDLLASGLGTVERKMSRLVRQSGSGGLYEGRPRGVVDPRRGG